MNNKQKYHPWTILLCLGLILAWMLSAAGLSRAQTCSAAAPVAVSAPRTLVPVGKTVGIKLFSRGVLVVGLSQVSAEDGVGCPAKACGLKVGDVITQLNGQSVDSIEEVQEVLQCCDGTVSVTATRGGRKLSLSADISPSPDGSYRLGAWIRDSMAGIGTVTFYDPETGRFAALGHGITDVDTGQLMPLHAGSIMPASVSGILPGSKGSPGALHGTFDLTRDIGSISENTSWGIFGTAESGSFSGVPVEVASPQEVKPGSATILANLSGDLVEEYSVEILRVYSHNGPQKQNLMLRITDSRILDRTGGIVQGMSGSPILQNGKLVGAVTHVFINDPTRGYGIFIDTMLNGSS